MSKYQVFVCRYAFSESFEKAHSIGIRLTVKQGDQVLHAEDKYSWSWYSDIPCTKPFTPGGEEGRRYLPFVARLISKFAQNQQLYDDNEQHIQRGSRFHNLYGRAGMSVYSVLALNFNLTDI